MELRLYYQIENKDEIETVKKGQLIDIFNFKVTVTKSAFSLLKESTQSQHW